MVEKYLKRDQLSNGIIIKKNPSYLVKDLLLMVIKKPASRLESLKADKPELYEAVMRLKPNIFTYSMLFKVMAWEIKSNKKTSKIKLIKNLIKIRNLRSKILVKPTSTGSSWCGRVTPSPPTSSS